MVFNLARSTASQDEEDVPKWFNSPVTFYCKKSLKDIADFVPRFERVPFALNDQSTAPPQVNARFDTIVRCPQENLNQPHRVPVGIVSKNYVLIQHTQVIEQAKWALASVNIDPANVRADLAITEYGERIALSLFLPEDFNFDPGDNNPMALRLECINSVDGSTRFRALMGWFRFVCSNGLIIGVTRSDLRKRHFGDFQLKEIGTVLTSGIRESKKEIQNFKRWQKVSVNEPQIAAWADRTVRKVLGFKAATRAYHIARTGFDVDIAGPYKDAQPTTIPVRKLDRVPGAPFEAQTLYDASQCLAWLAKERRDLQQQLEWREAIPSLMKCKLLTTP